MDFTISNNPATFHIQVVSIESKVIFILILIQPFPLQIHLPYS